MRTSSSIEITPEESDFSLGLHDDKWPLSLKSSTWEIETPATPPGAGALSYLARRLKVAGEQDQIELDESLLLWPSAPIYGLNRKPSYQLAVPQRINYHSMRVMRAPGCLGTPAKRIYLIHNGLNETTKLGVYYRLAHCLLSSDPEAACILRPIPGHLSRYPFPERFSEKPLDRYLSDAGDLFRQFLRYMLETQWLLSALASLRDYRVVAATQLLAPGGADDLGRLDAAVVSAAILAEWNRLHRASSDLGADAGLSVSEEKINYAVASLRYVLGWEAAAAPFREVVDYPPAIDTPTRPSIHAIGYSLGGFYAQATFFAWPFMVASCVPLSSGGALRDIALTGFADREEWNHVLHHLRFEIDNGFLLQRFKVSEGKHEEIGGILTNHFGSFLRIFYEVFLQDYSAQYSSRLKEFVGRFFFMVGGGDPVVRPESVRKNSPPDGVNMLEIAGLSHFLFKPEHEQWHRLWLPQVAQLIMALAGDSEKQLAAQLHRYWWNATYSDLVVKGDEHSGKRRATKAPAVALHSAPFERELDAIVQGFEGQGGRLVIARNRPPASLLGEGALHHGAVALYHSEGEIAALSRAMTNRRTILERSSTRVHIIISKMGREWASQSGALLAAQNDAPAGQRPDAEMRREIVDRFESEWGAKGSLRYFQARFGAPERLTGDAEELVKLTTALLYVSGRYKERRLPLESEVLMNTLPDAWIFLGNFMKLSEGYEKETRQASARWSDVVIWWARRLAEEECKRQQSGPARKEVSDALQDGSLRIIKVSGAGFNPRHRGYRIMDAHDAIPILIHLGLSYCYSEAFPELKSS